jgi:hypothetical protein
MKTRAPPLSSSHGKDEESAPNGDAPMERFRRLASGVMQVPYKTVKELEEKELKASRKKRRRRQNAD